MRRVEQAEGLICSPRRSVQCAPASVWCCISYSLKTEERSWRQRACAPQASCLINQSPPQILPKSLFCRDRQAGASAIRLSDFFFLLMLTLWLLSFMLGRIQFSDPLKRDSHALWIWLAHTCMRSLTTSSLSLSLLDNYSAGLTATRLSLSSFLFCPSSATSFLSFSLSCFHSSFWDESSSALGGVGAHVGPAVRDFCRLSFWVPLL